MNISCAQNRIIFQAVIKIYAYYFHTIRRLPTLGGAGVLTCNIHLFCVELSRAYNRQQLTVANHWGRCVYTYSRDAWLSCD